MTSQCPEYNVESWLLTLAQRLKAAILHWASGSSTFARIGGLLWSASDREKGAMSLLLQIAAGYDDQSCWHCSTWGCIDAVMT